MDLRAYLFDVNPYAGFPADDYPFDTTTTFNQPEALFRMLGEWKPRRLIEVGTWKGTSALRMAKILQDAGVDFHLVCVDTWLGAEEMWTRGERELFDRYNGLRLKHGYPRLYDQFLANVVKAGLQGQITPFPVPSVIAGRILAKVGYRADFIYIDGSHHFDDVQRDLDHYWPLVEVGGHLGGDDYRWGDVHRAVGAFAKSQGLAVVEYPGGGWSVARPGAA